MADSEDVINWSDLPTELLEQRIWSYLPIRSILASGMTCTAWHDALLNLYNLDISYRGKNGGSTITDTHLKHFMSQFQNLYSVTLTGAPNLTWSHIDAISQSCGANLNSLALNLSSGTALNGSTWTLTNSFPSLQHLDIKGCIVPISACIPSVFPPRLLSLRLSSCLKVTDQSLELLSAFLKGLQRFEARGVYRLTDLGMKSLLQANPGLTTIDLSSLMNLTNATLLCATQSCPNMTTFIARATNFSGVALASISAAWSGTLTHLALKMCSKMTESDVCDHLLPGLTKLEILDLQKAPLSENSPILRVIGECCPNLRVLDLRDCCEWKAVKGEWTSFLSACPSMTSLYLRSPTITDQIMEEISLNAPNMESLYLQECTSITDFGIQVITEAVLSGRLRRLHRLTITEIPFDHHAVGVLTARCPSVLTTHLKNTDSASKENGPSPPTAP